MRLVWCVLVAALLCVGADANRKLSQASEADQGISLPNLADLLPSIRSSPRGSGSAAPAAAAEGGNALDEAPADGDGEEPEGMIEGQEADVAPEQAASLEASAGDEEAANMAEDTSSAPAEAESDASEVSADDAAAPAEAESIVAAEAESADPASATDSAAGGSGEGVHHLNLMTMSNMSHTFGGKKLLPEITITKEFDQPGNYSDDFKPEKPELPVKPKFSLTKIEHILEKPEKPDESRKKLHITEKKWKDTEIIDKNVKKSPLNVNVTIIKDKGFKMKPYIIKPELNISVVKFKHDEFTNYHYKPEEKNVTVTLIKPEKEKWHKGANKTWVVEKKYKGLTVSTQLVEPAIIGGPLYDKFGERYVCYFPGITPQPSAMKVVKLPAAAAKKLAETSPYSFVAPPPGSTVFGPSCYLYDYKCNYGLGQPCTGHGFCSSEFPNTCTCLFGFKSCTPLGTSYGCETNVNYDTNNCGQCGQKCEEKGAICCRGQCVIQSLSACLLGLSAPPPPPATVAPPPPPVVVSPPFSIPPVASPPPQESPPPPAAP